jgi:oligopeptide/dipeptide ABC transporter ATP-binding protein
MIQVNRSATVAQPFTTDADAPLIRVRDLYKQFVMGGTLLNRLTGGRPRVLKAVDGVTFDIHRGEVLGLVGESGCGKTTLGRCLLRLYEASNGEIYFEGRDLLSLKGEELRALRTKMQIIFQNPYSSLNPRMKVGSMLAEALLVHGLCTKDEASDRVGELLGMVGLSPSAADRYPSMFSGGQRQRISIARALAVRPKFIVADEPVSALDVSVQAQILNLLMDIEKELHLTMLFIAHDLSVVRYIANRVAVMYLGRIVELAPVQELFEDAKHPYTRALLRSVPRLEPQRMDLAAEIAGDPPSPLELPSGCRFHPRCPHVRKSCAIEDPALVAVNPGHMVACWLGSEPERC